MNKNKILLSSIVCCTMFSFSNAGTFDFSTDGTNNSTTYTSNGDDVELTISPAATIFYNQYLDEVELSSFNQDIVNFTFNKAIDIESISFYSYSTTDTIVQPKENVQNSSFTFLSGDSGTTVTPTLNWKSITEFYIQNSGTLAFSIDNIVFTIADVSTYLDAVTTISGDSNTKKTAQTLQNIKDNGGYSRMSSVFTALDALSTDSQKAQKIEETTPQTATSSFEASSLVSNGISNIVSQRQNVNLGAGINSGDEMFIEKNIWFKPYGSIGSQNDKDGINGFDINTYGLAFGVDGEY